MHCSYTFVILCIIYGHCSIVEDMQNHDFTKCGENLVKISGHCYLFMDEVKLSWKRALRSCQRGHGTLAQPRTPEENEGIKRYIKHVHPKCVRYWFGLQQESSFFTSTENDTSDFTFLDGKTPSYNDWGIGEPSGHAEHCVHYRCHKSGIKWKNSMCRRKCAYICQQDDCPETCSRKAKSKPPASTVSDNLQFNPSKTTISSNDKGSSAVTVIQTTSSSPSSTTTSSTTTSATATSTLTKTATSTETATPKDAATATSTPTETATATATATDAATLSTPFSKSIEEECSAGSNDSESRSSSTTSTVMLMIIFERIIFLLYQ